MQEQMLINATQPEEIRVAFVKNKVLSDLIIQTPGKEKKGNIYKATVTRCEPSLDAVFVEYGSKRQGFLPLKEIAPEYLSKNPEEFDENNKPPITALIREGQELLIQVDKEERGSKGAALTTFITLAGCYLVLMPNNPRSGGISRRIEGDERDELRETLNALELPEDMGLIIRTAGVGKSPEELQDDLTMLCNQWQSIMQAYQTELAPCLIHQEGDIIIRSIRDNLYKSVNEIIIDDQVTFVKVKEYFERLRPKSSASKLQSKLKLPELNLYNNSIPLFILYQIENQIETAYKRQVMLPSGGALVIDRTEALVSIDINSAKATSGADIETTAVNTNLEAADEIARQLRLRDLGGLIVIDFIDMSSSKNQRDVENRLKEALQTDKARIQVGRISRFGLLEMSRQRLRLSLGETVQEVCPRCEGRGTVRNIPSHSLSILRLIEEEALKEKTAEIQVQMPPDMATFIINEKRDFIMQIEKRHKVNVVLIANPFLQSPQYLITRIKEENMPKGRRPSYSLIQQPELEVARSDQQVILDDEPAVKTFAGYGSTKTEQAPFMKRLWGALFGKQALQSEKATETEQATPSQRVERTPQRRQQAHAHRRRRPSGSGSSSSSTPMRSPQSGNSNNPQRRRNPHGSQHAQQNPRQNTSRAEHHQRKREGVKEGGEE